VTAKVSPDLTAFSVVAPVVEEEPVPAAEVAAGPEVITEKKPGEGEAAPAAAAAAPAKEKEPKK